MVDKDRGDRPVFVSLWYPADARDVHPFPAPARYLTDAFSGHLPPTFSTDWERVGYDPAYEAPTPSADAPFPLLMFSSGWGCDSWFYIYIGTRLASNGYVVAVTEHWADSQWSWSPSDDLLTVMVNRPQDVSFALTQLLAKSTTPGELLYRAIDPERIAAGGHSIGGYTTYTLAGGNDMVCDALWPALNGLDTLPYPADTCVPTPRDPRIKAIISLDGASELLRYDELARISVPSLIMGDTVDQSEAIVKNGDLRDWIARPHAAIHRDDSYRVDVNGTNHYSWTTYCDAGRVWFSRGWISSAGLAGWETSWPCANTGWFRATIPAAEAHDVITGYMIAMLDLEFGDPLRPNRWIPAPEYALGPSQNVQFFRSEHCRADLPDHSYFRYRDYQDSSDCDVAKKNPTGWFASQPRSSDFAPMFFTPAAGEAFRPLKKPF